ncbi:MAG: hypothetical protein H7Z13_07150 [Ferruginibacter sp.]|nr:hypothetical protein [Ferruginibacter sp.]
MKLQFQDQVPTGFNDASRVWIYQCNRLFLLNEALQIEKMLEQFVKGWTSHGAGVTGYANLFFGQFIVLLADETSTSVGGCSTDSSVRMIKEIEQKMSVQLFERQTLAFVVKDKIQLLPLSQLNYAIQNNFIDGETLYFNNTVLTKKELFQNWIIPIKNSWLAKRINFPELTK